MNQNPKIHRIDKTNHLIENLVQTEIVIKKIISTYYEKHDIKAVIPPINSFIKGNVTYYLYLFNTNEVVSDWRLFLPIELTQNVDFKQQQLSLLLFAETSIDLYCIVGGIAYQIIVPFIDHSYGLNTYARIMKPETDQLSSIKSRGITGHRAGMSEQFRDNYRIIDYIKFGKIPQEIHLILSEEIADLHFSFLKSKESDSIQIYVGKSFQIKKPVDFEKLHKIFLELDVISQLAPSDYLSSYKEIQDIKFINNSLKQELITKIYNDAGTLGRNTSGIKRFEHDFCNPNNIEKFYEADSYKLREKSEKGGYRTFETVYNRKEIYETVLKRAVELVGNNDRFNFMIYLQGVRICCMHNDKKTVASNFLFHINTEFTLSGKSYFLVDAKWYNLRNSFLEDLKASAKHILRTYKAPSNILYIPWNKEETAREGDYNLKYNGIPNYIVIDTIIVDGLELCDILFFNDNTLYLIHVKYGFTSTLRELDNQINIAARRLKDVLGTNDKLILKKIYGQIIQKG